MNWDVRACLFEENNAFRNHDRNIAVDVPFTRFIEARDSHIRVRNAGNQANTEYIPWWLSR